MPGPEGARHRGGPGVPKVPGTGGPEGAGTGGPEGARHRQGDRVTGREVPGTDGRGREGQERRVPGIVGKLGKRDGVSAGRRR